MPTFPLRQTAAEALIEKYKNQINDNSGIEIVNSIKKELESKIKTAEELAIQAYKILNIQGNNLEQMESNLNKKIVELQYETQSLNGELLQKSFIDAINEVSAYSYDEQNKYEAFIKYIEDQLNKDIEDSEEAWIEFSIAAIAEVLGENRENFGIGSNGQKGSANRIMIKSKTKSGALGKYATGLMDREFNNLGEKTAQKLSKWFKDHPDVIEKYTKKTVTNNRLTIETEWENFPVERFLKMTNVNKHERDRFFEAYNLKQKIIEKYRAKILSNCTHISEKNRGYLRQAIDQVIFAKVEKNGTIKDVDALFGLNGTNLTGLLGEIQALFFTLALTEGKSGAKWIGGIGNPHADLLLINALDNFGIQVKNSTINGGRQEVAFQNFNTSIQTITDESGVKNKKRTSYVGNNMFQYKNTSQASQALDQLFSTNILPNGYGLAEAIETILGMYTFNVEYLWETVETKYTNKKGIEKTRHKKYYFPGNNKEFRPTREKIIDLTNKSQKIMDLFSVAMMYMQTSNNSNGQSNTLYLIGGSTIISAASILKQIVKEIELNLEYEQRSFRVNMNTNNALEGNNFTIVDVFNGDKSISSLHFALQSSYTFNTN